MTAAAAPDPHRNRDDAVLLPFDESHLQGALELSQQMSWPYRLDDWAVALQLGQGFVLQSAGRVIGTAVWWAYGETHASAGMIIVAKAVQGFGYGARLTDALLAAAHPRSITLNSTAEGLALYQRRGFAPVGVIHQHQGELTKHRLTPPSNLVRAIAPADAETIERLDREATGWVRRQMLERLLQSGDGFLLVRDGEPRGYAISRLFGRGHVIGPVVADNPTDAHVLIEAALARIGRTFVRVDTPATSRLGAWLEDIGLQRVGDVTTMVRGTRVPPPGPSRVFALASQSFN
jgi:GNAT superfamily N-acetyltransferase